MQCPEGRTRAIEPCDVEMLFTEGLAACPQPNRASGEVTIACDGVLVARAIEREGRCVPTHMACDAPCHGPHPRHRAAYDRMYEQFGALLPRPSPGSCPKCSGGGWIPVGTPAAQRQFIQSVSFRMFRGVVLPPRATSELNSQHVRDTIAVFVARGASPPAAAPGEPEGASDAEVKEWPCLRAKQPR